MNPVDDGGPAFPYPHVNYDNSSFSITGSEGMTLRDWFAGLTLQALISLQSTHEAMAQNSINRKEVADECYAYADAMIAERKGGAR